MFLIFLREKNTGSFLFFIIAIAYTYFFGASLFLLRSRVENSTHIGAVHSVSTSGRRLSRTSAIYVFLPSFSCWNGGRTWPINFYKIRWRPWEDRSMLSIRVRSGMKIYSKLISIGVPVASVVHLYWLRTHVEKISGKLWKCNWMMLI